MDMHWSLQLILICICTWIVVGGMRKWWSDRKINQHVKKLQRMGYEAGRVGMPPTFYEKMAMDLDSIDELAIGQGWDAGWEEFQKLPEKEQAQLKSINEANGSLPAD